MQMQTRSFFGGNVQIKTLARIYRLERKGDPVLSGKSQITNHKLQIISNNRNSKSRTFPENRKPNLPRRLWPLDIGICNSFVMWCLLFGISTGMLLLPSLAMGDAAFRIDGSDFIIDQAGRKLHIKEPFKRVISLYGAHTENLYSLGLGEETIGVSRHEAYPPEALAKPRYSYREDPEKFLSARPDLVLIRPMIDRGYPQLMARLEKSGIAVASLQPGSVTDIYTYWTILGRLTGKEENAKRMIAHFKAGVASLRSITEKLAAKKKVYFEAVHSKMKTFSPGSMAIFALEAAGGINVAADATPVRKTNIAAYGKERILSHAGEIDVYLAQFGAMNRPSVSQINSEPGFQAIKAIKENQVYLIDEKIVSRPTMRLLMGIYEIGSKLYPELFTKEILNQIAFKNP